MDNKNQYEKFVYENLVGPITLYKQPTPMERLQAGLTETEMKLIRHAEETLKLNFRPDTYFYYDWEKNVVGVDLDRPQALRVLALAHEIGHATRDRQGFLRANVPTTNRFALSVMDQNGRRKYYLEEVMAWREGFKLLRKLQIRVSRQAKRKFYTFALATYRHDFRIDGPHFRRAKVTGC